MRLLLDVHHSRHAAERLRDEGHDVVAAADDQTLRDAADEELLSLASIDNRALVTENVKDFDRLVRQRAESGTHHAGVIFTSPRRFHRGCDHRGAFWSTIDFGQTRSAKHGAVTVLVTV